MVGEYLRNVTNKTTKVQRKYIVAKIAVVNVQVRYLFAAFTNCPYWIEIKISSHTLHRCKSEI